MTMNVEQKTVIGWTAGLSIVYAVTRYHFFKGVPFQQFFPEILNKGLSLAAILLISLSLSVGPLSRQFPDKFNNLLLGKRLFGLWGFVFAFLHSLVSIHFYKPDHYPKFFSLEHLNFIGKFVLYFGVVSLILLSIAFIVSFPKKLNVRPIIFQRSQFIGFVGLIIGGAHVIPIGAQGWFHPYSWPGYLIPITLISFIVVLITIICRILFNSIMYNSK